MLSFLGQEKPYLQRQLLVNVNSQTKKAIIEFNQTTIDYGTIEKGSNGVREFVFKNTPYHQGDLHHQECHSKHEISNFNLSNIPDDSWI